MTHLYIEQDTGSTEEVNSSIISKLYELASSGNLDETSDLKGRLHSNVAYRSEAQYLTSMFSELYISADVYYKHFVDPAMAEFFAKCPAGDGIGITEDSWDLLESEWSNKNTTYNYCNNANYFGSYQGSNSNYKSILEVVEHFPELVDLPCSAAIGGFYTPICQHFVNIKEIYCPKSVNCVNFEIQGFNSSFIFQKLELIDFSTAPNTYSAVNFTIYCNSAPKLKKIILPPSVTYFTHGFMSGNGTFGDSNGIDIFMYTTDISNVTNDASTWVFEAASSIRLWVQDSIYNDWLNHKQVANSNKVTVKKFSEYTGNDLVQKWLPQTT